MIIEVLKAILFGIVQGITEWLPISSTGHMILLDEFVKLKMSADFKDMFLVVIQFGSILAVVVTFWRRLFTFNFKKQPFKQNDTVKMWLKIIIACIPAALIIPWNDKIDELFYNYKVVSIALIVFGILFIVIENHNKGRRPKVNSINDITYQMALIIGVFQLIAAVFPGTSRSGATIIGALLIGISRSTATEFTFFLAVPVMLGASLIKITQFGFDFTSMELTVLLVGMVVAFVVSMFIIKFLTNFVKKHDFKVFGWYRIVLGLAVLVYFLVQTH